MEHKTKSSSNLFVKECIVSALLRLIYEKPLSVITISELCSRAGVSRMAFYRNYTSKEDIFAKEPGELFEKYKEDDERLPKAGIYYDNKHMVHYFSYLYTYREYLAGLHHCGFGILFLEMLNQYILTEWKGTADPYTLTAFSGSLYNFFLSWSATNSSETAELLAERLEHIFQPAVP